MINEPLVFEQLKVYFIQENQSIAKELSSWLFTGAIYFSAVLAIDLPFPFGVQAVCGICLNSCLIIVFSLLRVFMYSIFTYYAKDGS